MEIIVLLVIAVFIGYYLMQQNNDQTTKSNNSTQETSRDEILQKIDNSDMSETVKNILKSKINANSNPTVVNPLIDRNPPSSDMDNFFNNLISRLRADSGLQKIYGGYNKITNTVTTGFESFGMTSLIGFDINQINNMIENKDVFVCYIALPIDDMDNLIENPGLWDETLKNVF